MPSGGIDAGLGLGDVDVAGGPPSEQGHAVVEIPHDGESQPFSIVHAEGVPRLVVNDAAHAPAEPIGSLTMCTYLDIWNARDRSTPPTA